MNLFVRIFEKGGHGVPKTASRAGIDTEQPDMSGCKQHLQPFVW